MIVTGMAVGGCGSPGPAPTERVQPSPVAAAVPNPQLDSPLAPYMLSWRELTIVNHARSIHLSGCLADAGYELPVGDLQEELEQARLQEISDLSRMFGITDREAAAQNGYWPPEPPPAPPVNGIPAAILRQCASVADKKVGRTPGRSPYGLARELLIQSRSNLEEQPAAKRAIRRWVTCMADAGYEVTSPISDSGDIARELRARVAREEAGTVGPSRHELALAQADIACKSSQGTSEALNRNAMLLDFHQLAARQADLRDDRLRLDQLVAASNQIRKSCDVNLASCGGDHLEVARKRTGMGCLGCQLKICG